MSSDELSSFVNRDDWESHWERLRTITRLNPADAYRYGLVLRALELQARGAGARILDAGCGSGTLLALCANRYPEAQLLGLDFSRTGLSMAASQVPNASFAQVDLTTVSLPPPPMYSQWATHAICSEVIEHLDQPDSFLRNLKRWLTPDAQFVLTVPSGPMAYYHHHVGHRRHYTCDDLASLLSATGYIVHKVQRAGFPFFNLYRLLTQMRGKKLIHDVQTSDEGRKSNLLHLAFAILRPCFRLNLSHGPFGWQLLATATNSHFLRQ